MEKERVLEILRDMFLTKDLAKEMVISGKLETVDEYKEALECYALVLADAMGFSQEELLNLRRANHATNFDRGSR